jgi:prepilin-type processing-associated H-X9-DG protein
MNTAPTISTIRAFSRLDLVIAMTLGIVLAMVFLSSLADARRKTQRIDCVENLKQVGLAFRIWSTDSSSDYPTAVSTNRGGSKEYTGTNDAFRHFLVMSNELMTPKILVCPADNRAPVDSFTNLSNQSISYFVGMDATEPNPASILSGDRNLTHNGELISGLFPITTNTILGWSSSIHRHAGNIAFGDGSAQLLTSSALAEFVRNSNGSNRLLIP